MKKSKYWKIYHKASLVIPFLVLASFCSHAEDAAPFTVVVIPDTQNYVDYTRQKFEDFAIDGSELYIRQMQHIAGKGVANDGDVVFVASVGDVWQHVLSDMDPEHKQRGVGHAEGASSAAFSALIKPDETMNIEIPKAIEGYQLISAAGIPFGVAPGNHDYDAWWVAPVVSDAAVGNDGDIENTTEIHIGGLDAFRAAFGSHTDFFRDKEWYVRDYRGGTSSAQIFSVGDWRFLHLALEMQPGDEVLEWAQEVIDDYPGLPTIISTHDYLSARGERKPYADFDLSLADPGFNNSAEQLWSKFISVNDQIFMLLCGHQLGQAVRVDKNNGGHDVYQILADYQGRGQAALDAGQPLEANGSVAGVGDGWYREMTFHLEQNNPRILVKTYSSHYQKYSGNLQTYAQWYKPQEQPQMSDAEFHAADEFVIHLDDFHDRFATAE